MKHGSFRPRIMNVNIWLSVAVLALEILVICALCGKIGNLLSYEFNLSEFLFTVCVATFICFYFSHIVGLSAEHCMLF